MINFQRKKLCITEMIHINLKKKQQHFVTIEGSLVAFQIISMYL